MILTTRSSVGLGLVLIAALAPVTLLAACSSSDHPAASSSGGTVTHNPGDPTTNDGGVALTDGGSGDAATCEGLMLSGDPANEVDLAGDAPPPLGGPLTPGTYHLTELYTYTPFPPDAGPDTPVETITGNTENKQLVLTSNTIRFIEAKGTATGGLGKSDVMGGTYVTGGTDLHVAFTCPTTGAATYGYSAGASGLVLYVDKRREIYKLLP